MNLINRAKASFEARVIQPNMQKHFENTAHGKKLAQLKNKYAGVLELVYIRVLEALAERIKGSIPFACTKFLIFWKVRVLELL